MTIDARPRRARLALTLAGVAAAWLALMAGAMFIPGAAPSALVIAPRAGFLDRLPAGATLAGNGRLGLIVAGASAAALYRAGARLVLPAGLPLCAAPPGWQARPPRG